MASDDLRDRVRDLEAAVSDLKVTLKTTKLLISGGIAIVLACAAIFFGLSKANIRSTVKEKFDEWAQTNVVRDAEKAATDSAAVAKRSADAAMESAKVANAAATEAQARLGQTPSETGTRLAALETKTAPISITAVGGFVVQAGPARFTLNADGNLVSSGGTNEWDAFGCCFGPKK